MILVLGWTCMAPVVGVVVVMGAYPIEAGIMLATDRDKGFSAWIVTEGHSVTLVPRQLTIFVVIREDFAFTEGRGIGWLFAGCAEVMLMVSEGQRSAKEAIVIAPRDWLGPKSISGLLELLLELLLLLPLLML